jgi:putative DNA primase/helicase
MTGALSIIKALGGDAATGMCCCPAHDDKRASLHISEKSGKVLWKCHAGCAQDRVRQALIDKGLWTTAPSGASAREQAREEANRIWKAAKPAWDRHAYCKRKGVQPAGLKMELRNSASPLLIPVYDEKASRVNIQFVHTDGKKHYIAGGPSKDCHYWIAKPGEVSSKTILICEGWATGASAHAATNYAVIMTFGKANLLSVAKWVRKKYPDQRIILLADDDGGDGIAKAGEAAQVVNGLVAIPKFGPGPKKHGKDFNDLHVSKGVRAVKRCIDTAADPNPTDAAMPIIRVVDGEIARIVDHAQSALIKSELPIFINSGRLTEPIDVEREAADGFKTLSTVLASINERKVTYHLNKRAAEFQRFDKRSKAWVKINPPSYVAPSLLGLREWKFPEVIGIVGAPTMRPDGSLLSKRGYDAQTRLWCNAGMTLPPIPKRPTRQQAMDALQLFKELISGFPFVSKTDKATALAAILTVILRGAFDLTPMFLITAHDISNGKSFFVNLLAMLVTGRSCPVITAGRNQDELEKRLGGVLLEGGAVISLDNLSFDLQSDLLCQILTERTVKVRILGKSEVPECEWRGTIFATGNNVRVLGDLVRRVLTCQLDAKVERPELRKFSFNPIARVQGNREAYIAAAITIAHAYRTVGRDAPPVRPLAGFEAWSAIVREPLLWLGEHDPVKSMDAARAADPARAAAYELITHLQQRFGLGETFSVRDAIAIANETKNTAGTPRYPKFRALLLEHAGTMKRDAVDPVRLGRWLQLQHGRVYGGLRIDLIPRKGYANEYVVSEIEDNSAG